MPIDRLRGMSAISSDRELNDDSSIPEWKKMLIMKKRAERLTSSETNKANATNDALRTVAPPLTGEKAGFKGVYPATCDAPPLSHLERHHEEIKTLRNSPPSIHSDASAVKPIDDLVESTPPLPLPITKHVFRRPNANRRPKMGEDKNVSNLDRTDNVDGIPAYPGHPTYRPEDEDERDLQYGPGIVNKLKSRFINMTLKESIKASAVDSGRIGIRRYSSLENLLEKENCLRFGDCTSKGRLGAPINRTRGKYASRNTNFKRAKSMETLLIEHERQLSSSLSRPNRGQRPASVAGHLSESPLINENLIIVESSSSCKDVEAGKHTKPTRQVPLPNAINEEELPKPDTVKTYKRMFEPADTKIGHTVRRKPPVVRASTKAASAVNKPTGPKHNATPNSKRPGRTVPPVLNGYQPAKVSAKEPCVVESGDAMNGESKPIIVENGMPPEPEEIIDISDKIEAQSIVAAPVIPTDGDIPSPTSPIPSSRDSESPETEEESEVLKPSTLIGNRQSLWQKPPPSTTSIVFDFRGKDVKPNIGLNPTPFGCKPAHVVRKKRSGSPPRIGGKDTFPCVNGSINGDDGYDDDDYGIGADLPLHSGIIFEGENIKVGRGSLLNTRNKKLRIQFNDTATSTFEYPSEASLLEGSPSPNSPNEHSQIECDASSTTGNALLRPSAAGSSGGLANYTPSMLTETDTFRLGVTRPVFRESDTSQKHDTEPAGSQEELLKPADPEDMSSWSSSSTTSDLLF